MVGIQIPNLVRAHCQADSEETTLFGEHVIAKYFISSFLFKDGNKFWRASFEVAISKFGTPALLTVKLEGSNIVQADRGWTVLDVDETFRFINPASIERWQLKFVEQFRFQLFELAISLAVEMGEPEWGVLDGESFSFWPGRDPLSEFEIKKLLKNIDKKIRQKITPDFLAKVASIYTEAGLRGERPIKAIEEFYKCSHRTAQDYATKARMQKLLPETTPGKVTVKKPKVKRVEK